MPRRPARRPGADLPVSTRATGRNPLPPAGPDEILARIRRLSPALSSGQRKVVDFFLSRCDEAVFSTSARVAASTGVSEATVVRTAHALGFDGYPALRTALQSYFVARMSTVTRVKLTAGRRRGESEIIDELLGAELANLEATRRRLDHKAMGRAAELVASARRVYVVGLRSGYSLAWLLYFSLRLVRGNARLLTPGMADVPEQLEGVGRGDVVIGLTFERYTRATVELFRACLAKGATGVAITDKATSPLAEGAAVVLEAQTRLSSFVDSFVAPTALINVLLTLIAARRRRRALRALADREEDWRRHRTYLP
jgi:DNA-binding MurR/RpiR family transcriptional regulator